MLENDGEHNEDGHVHLEHNENQQQRSLTFWVFVVIAIIVKEKIRRKGETQEINEKPKGSDHLARLVFRFDILIYDFH